MVDNDLQLIGDQNISVGILVTGCYTVVVVDLYHRLHSVRSVIFVFLMYYANDPYVKGSYVRSNVIGVVNKTTLYFIWQTSYYCTNSITYIIQSDFKLLYINSGELLTVRGAPQFNGFTIQCTSAQFCGDQYRVRCCWYTAIDNCFFLLMSI